MICLRLAVLIVLFLAFVSSFDDMETLHEQYLNEQTKIRKEICVLKPEYGKCKGRRSLWYFNNQYGKCQTFTYSNCGGNRNRFYTKEACIDFCDRFDWKAENLKRFNIKAVLPNTANPAQ